MIYTFSISTIDESYRDFLLLFLFLVSRDRRGEWPESRESVDLFIILAQRLVLRL